MYFVFPQVFCELDLTSLTRSLEVNSQEVNSQEQPLTNLSLRSLQLGRPVTLSHVIAALSHGSLVATAEDALLGGHEPATELVSCTP